MLLTTPRVPLPKKLSSTKTAFACPQLSNSKNPAGAMAPPMLKCQESICLNKLSQSDCSPSTQVLLLYKSSGDVNVPQPKASTDQNILEYQPATFGKAKRVILAILFTNVPWPILFNDKYSMIEDTWKLAIEAQDHQ
jgi:hypothetical protein